MCFIENIKEEKKNKLKYNIRYLTDLSKNLEKSIKELKILYDKIDVKKDELKLMIHNIFTKIRSALNERENELLSEVDDKFNEIFGHANTSKIIEKLPNKIKILLEKAKLLENDWNDNDKLSSIITNCIAIENNIQDINLIDKNMKKYDEYNINIYFNIDMENFINTIKSLGYLKYIDSLI